MSLTGSNTLGLCFDTGHCGGGDPVEMLTQHADHIWHIHFKDFDPTVVEFGKLVVNQDGSVITHRFTNHHLPLPFFAIVVWQET